MNKNLKVILMISNIKFNLIFKSFFFEITINLAIFFEKIKINTNDVTKNKLVVNFHHFTNIKGAINIIKGCFNFFLIPILFKKSWILIVKI